ncbi:uncharacterized protein LOC133641470 [Entelurus aequoreus]|uniref:uncharacterized protein LOC133641470 n=1 Tax=Entelurus aequoreus TaxID=161455 RepID=UPI002B1E8AEE|nr:uncharacterized protein LOC133641470 [Entelurus aequoreus]
MTVHQCTKQGPSRHGRQSLHLDSPGNFARILFVDFSSAFNSLHKHLLIRKLHQLNIPPQLIHLTHNSLTDRLQAVRVGSNKSLMHTINTGVPQGCVLSPFLLYRARKGAFGQQIEDFLDKLDEQTSDIVSHRKMTALRCLPVFVRDDTTKFFLQHLKTGLKKECSEACLLASLQSLKKMILLYHPTYGTGLLCWKVPSCYMTCQTSVPPLHTSLAYCMCQRP